MTPFTTFSMRLVEKVLPKRMESDMLTNTPNLETVTEPTRMTDQERGIIVSLLREEARHRNAWGMESWELRDLAHRIEWEEVR